MKIVLKIGLVIVMFAGNSSSIYGAAWSHSFSDPVANGQDIAFDGSGPNWQSWVATLERVHQGSLTYLEQDTGSVNGGGVLTGEYKLSDEGRNGWVNNSQQTLKSTLRHSGTVVDTQTFGTDF